MKIRWLLLIAVMTGFAAAACAQDVVYESAPIYRSGYSAGNVWNPLTGYAPWQEPVGAPVVTSDGTIVRREIVRERIVEPRYIYGQRWYRRYENDLNLGGYPNGYPSYTYHYYNP